MNNVLQARCRSSEPVSSLPVVPVGNTPNWDSGEGIDNMIGQDDRWYARRLPDDFIVRQGESAARIDEVVKENWWGHCDEDRALLVEALLPILGELLTPGGEVTEEHRDLCEGVVDTWLTQV